MRRGIWWASVAMACWATPAASQAPDAAARAARVRARLATLAQAVAGTDADAVVAAIVGCTPEPHSSLVPPIAQLCADDRDPVARAACEAVGYIGAGLAEDPLELQRAVNVLAVALDASGERPVVATAAATGLGHLRHPTAIPPLLAVLDAPPAAVREAAQGALSRLTRQPHTTPEAWRTWWSTAGAGYELPPGSGDRPPPPKPPAPAAGDPVSRAVERAVHYLYGLHPDARPYVPGQAIHLLAIHYAQRDNDPRWRRAVDAFADAPPPQQWPLAVYETAAQLMVLARDDARRWQQQIARRAWWLVNAQGESGAWTYQGPGIPVPTQHPRAAITRSRFQEAVATGHLREGDDPMQTILIERTAPWARLPAHDLSNTQIAVLALYAAEQAHIRCPDATWQHVAKAYVDGSVRGGGWSYIILKLAVPTASMTAGGIGSLAMVEEIFDKKVRGHDALVKAAWKRLDRAGPFAEWRGGRTDPRGDQQSIYFYYWLYSLERAAVLEGRARLGGRDWFAVLSEYLVKSQNADGSWGPPDGHDGTTLPIYRQDRGSERAASTALAVLFLARAAPLRRVQLTKGLQRGPSTPADPADAPRAGD